MKLATIAAVAAFMTLAIAPWSTARATECPEIQPITIASLDMGTRFPQIAIGIEHGIFKKHCVDLTVLPLKGPRDVSVVLNDRQVDAAATIEPVIEAYINADGELPVIYGVMSYESNVLVGTAPLSGLVGKVIAIGRCPEITEHADGSLWGDITDPASEKYGGQPPSLVTLATFALIRNAVADGTLPAETRIICGRGFTDGFRPDVAGPVVYVEEGQGALRRDEMLIDGSVVATSVNLDQVPNLQRLVSDLVVYPDVLDRSNLFVAGLFGYPSIYEEKSAAFCGFAKAVQEANDALLAGTIADKPLADLTVDDLDAEAKGAYELFEEAIAFDELPNRFPGALTLKNLDGTGVDETATRAARLETFVRLRQSFLRPNIAVGEEELQDFSEIFRLKKTVAYRDPCA